LCVDIKVALLVNVKYKKPYTPWKPIHFGLKWLITDLLFLILTKNIFKQL